MLPAKCNCCVYDQMPPQRQINIFFFRNFLFCFGDLLFHFCCFSIMICFLDRIIFCSMQHSRLWPQLCYISWKLSSAERLRTFHTFKIDTKWNCLIPTDFSEEYCTSLPFSSFQAIKNAPGCIHPLISRVLPYIGPILSNVRKLY